MANPSDNTEHVVELRTNEPAKVLRLGGIHRFDDGSGYECVLTVVSGGFSCTLPFYFDGELLDVALRTLREMDGGCPKAATISGRWMPEFVQIRSNEMGHVFVSGELFEHSESPQQLKFSFRTDQTVLGPFLKDFQAVRDHLLSGGDQ